jgi:hypothetical protein
MTYRFSAPTDNGLETVQLKQQIKGANAARLQPGEAVTVIYHPGDPKSATAKVD